MRKLQNLDLSERLGRRPDNLLIGNSSSIELNQFRGRFADEYGAVPIGIA